MRTVLENLAGGLLMLAMLILLSYEFHGRHGRMPCITIGSVMQMGGDCR